LAVGTFGPIAARAGDICSLQRRGWRRLDFGTDTGGLGPRLRRHDDDVTPGQLPDGATWRDAL